MKTRINSALAVFLLLALSACASSPTGGPADGSMVQVASGKALDLPDSVSGAGEYTGKSEYRIGANDLLKISIFMNDELERELRVNASGQISLPLIGSVQAGGKTVLELETEIAEKLGKNYLQNPQVTVFIKEFTSQRVTIEGAVSKPGIYPIKGKTSLLQAVALAEGIDMNLARLDSILVFRTVNSQRMAAKFDLNLIRSGDAADPQIFGDDIIVVGVSSRKWAYRKFLESIPLVNAFILY